MWLVFASGSDYDVPDSFIAVYGTEAEAKTVALPAQGGYCIDYQQLLVEFEPNEGWMRLSATRAPEDSEHFEGTIEWIDL